MLALFKYAVKRGRGAMSALLLLYCFTLIPLAMIFWMSAHKHWIYFAFIVNLSLISGWIYHQMGVNVFKEVEYKKYYRNILFPVNILNAVFSGIFIIFPPKFFFYMAKLFDSFFNTTDVFVETAHSQAPNMYLGWILFMCIMNVFFIRGSIKYGRKSNSYKSPQVYPTW